MSDEPIETVCKAENTVEVEVKHYEGPVTCPKCGLVLYAEDSHSKFIPCLHCCTLIKKKYATAIIHEQELAYLLAVIARWQEIVNNLPTDRETAWKMFNSNPELLELKIEFERKRIQVGIPLEKSGK